MRKLKQDNIDIALLQDTHWDNNILAQAIEEWDFTIISTSYDTRARGTAILFRNSFEFSIGTKHIDPHGNYCISEISLSNGLNLVIGSIYCPNQDNPNFITNVDELIREFENPNVILGGDWNTTRNFSLDNLNYISQNNMRTTRAIDVLCNSLSLVDGWRINNPDKKKYTWLQGVSNKQARIDFFLCTDALLSISKDFKINPRYRSDHTPISFTLIISTENRGKGTWKMNNGLLSDRDFEILIKKSINDIKRTYARTPYNPDYIDSTNKNIDLMICPVLFWETLLVTLRGIIIDYAGKKNRDKVRTRRQLELNIARLDELVSTNNATPNDIEQLATLNTTLIGMRNEELKGAYIRSRAEWSEFGEKPSKFFLNLENRNRVNKNISEIKLDDDTILTEQKDIMTALKNFYEDLYKKRDNQPLPNINPDPTPTQLSQQEKNFLETAITKEELDLALSQMKNNKSPGLDGYSPEFFKKFWPQLGWFFLDSINTSFTLGRLPDSQTQGLITCIPKTGKARNLIKNWRPISLLNTSYKLISSCITNRMRKVLSRVISTEQKGFLEGRSIADCTRLMFDLINSCQVNNIDGLILLVDFEKAFDSLSWNFIQEALQKFNFGNNFIRWINIFQTNSNSRISLNGHLSDPFLLGRGCRQGDPISPYLFILCSEFLTLAFKESNLVEGLTIHRKEHRLNQYADDTSLFLKASERNLRNSLDILQWFYFKSGFKNKYSEDKSY